MIDSQKNGCWQVKPYAEKRWSSTWDTCRHLLNSDLYKCDKQSHLDNMALISQFQAWHHQGSSDTVAADNNLLQVANRDKPWQTHKVSVTP